MMGERVEADDIAAAAADEREGRLKLELFCLFQQRHLAQLLLRLLRCALHHDKHAFAAATAAAEEEGEEGGGDVGGDLLAKASNFARFLAAYFLDVRALPPPPAHLGERFSSFHSPPPHTSSTLPNLFRWAADGSDDENDDDDCRFATGRIDEREKPVAMNCDGSDNARSEEFAVVDGAARRRCWRTQVAQLLPAEYTPALALRLLLFVGHPLEAIYFADHFNDFRTALQLRWLLGCISPSLNHLFHAHCRAVFVERVACDETPPSPQNDADAVVQLDAIFFGAFSPPSPHGGGDGGGGGSLLNECLCAHARRLSASVRELLHPFIAFVDDDDDNDNESEDDEEEKKKRTSTYSNKAPAFTNDDAFCARLLRLARSCPRPPVYFPPPASAVDGGLLCSEQQHFFRRFPPAADEFADETEVEAEEELRCWAQIGQHVARVLRLLQRANRLRALVAHFTVWAHSADSEGLLRNDDTSNEQNIAMALLVEAQSFSHHYGRCTTAESAGAKGGGGVETMGHREGGGGEGRGGTLDDDVRADFQAFEAILLAVVGTGLRDRLVAALLHVREANRRSDDDDERGRQEPNEPTRTTTTKQAKQQASNIAEQLRRLFGDDGGGEGDRRRRRQRRAQFRKTDAKDALEANFLPFDDDDDNALTSSFGHDFVRGRGASSASLHNNMAEFERISKRLQSWMDFVMASGGGACELRPLQLFLRYADDRYLQQQQFAPHHAFLPPLNARSRAKWRATLLFQATHGGGGGGGGESMRQRRRRTNQANMLMAADDDDDESSMLAAAEEHFKFEIDGVDFACLAFLADHLPHISLDTFNNDTPPHDACFSSPSPPLIQIALRLRPSDVCRRRPDSSSMSNLQRHIDAEHQLLLDAYAADEGAAAAAAAGGPSSTIGDDEERQQNNERTFELRRHKSVAETTTLGLGTNKRSLSAPHTRQRRIGGVRAPPTPPRLLSSIRDWPSTDAAGVLFGSDRALAQLRRSIGDSLRRLAHIETRRSASSSASSSSPTPETSSFSATLAEEEEEEESSLSMLSSAIEGEGRRRDAAAKLADERAAFAADKNRRRHHAAQRARARVGEAANELENQSTSVGSSLLQRETRRQQIAGKMVKNAKIHSKTSKKREQKAKKSDVFTTSAEESLASSSSSPTSISSSSSNSSSRFASAFDEKRRQSSKNNDNDEAEEELAASAIPPDSGLPSSAQTTTRRQQQQRSVRFCIDADDDGDAEIGGAVAAVDENRLFAEMDAIAARIQRLHTELRRRQLFEESAKSATGNDGVVSCGVVVEPAETRHSTTRVAASFQSLLSDVCAGEVGGTSVFARATDGPSDIRNEERKDADAVLSVAPKCGRTVQHEADDDEETMWEKSRTTTNSAIDETKRTEVGPAKHVHTNSPLSIEQREDQAVQTSFRLRFATSTPTTPAASPSIIAAAGEEERMDASSSASNVGGDGDDFENDRFARNLLSGEAEEAGEKRTFLETMDDERSPSLAAAYNERLRDDGKMALMTRTTLTGRSEPPPEVTRLDFRHLRSSSSESSSDAIVAMGDDGGGGGGGGMFRSLLAKNANDIATKRAKKKRRMREGKWKTWTDLSVFPRTEAMGEERGEAQKQPKKKNAAAGETGGGKRTRANRRLKDYSNVDDAASHHHLATLSPTSASSALRSLASVRSIRRHALRLRMPGFGPPPPQSSAAAAAAATVNANGPFLLPHWLRLLPPSVVGGDDAGVHRRRPRKAAEQMAPHFRHLLELRPPPRQPAAASRRRSRERKRLKNGGEQKLDSQAKSPTSADEHSSGGEKGRKKPTPFEHLSRHPTTSAAGAAEPENGGATAADFADSGVLISYELSAEVVKRMIHDADVWD